jgi:curved DNA-binding protein CbpA
MRPAKVDYYAVLGLTPAATPEEIKLAFRRQARVYHPDNNNGDVTKFKEINEAQGILGDEEKRKAYDQERSNSFVEDISEAASSVVEEYFRQFVRS